MVPAMAPGLIVLEELPLGAGGEVNVVSVSVPVPDVGSNPDEEVIKHDSSPPPLLTKNAGDIEETRPIC